MGNHRFRFSDMIPNAWFYKLKDIGKTRKHQKQSSATSTSQTSHISQPINSYHFTRNDRICRSPINPKALDAHYPDPPRVSSKKKPKRRTIYRPSPKLVSTRSNSNFSSSHETSPELEADFHDHGSLHLSETDFEHLAAPDSFCVCEVTSSATDIIIDVNNTESFTSKFEKLDGFNAIYEQQLPPILTKPRKFDQDANYGRSSSEMEEFEASRSVSVNIVKRGDQNEPKPRSRVRKSTSGGIRLRSNTPKISSKKIQVHPRKSIFVSSRNRSLGESFAVVKSSLDPRRDFRESMVEMIVENNLRISKHLEELLACYLSLNSNEYHHIIVKAFEQIWLEMTDLHLHLPM